MCQGDPEQQSISKLKVRHICVVFVLGASSQPDPFLLSFDVRRASPFVFTTRCVYITVLASLSASHQSESDTT